MNLKIKSLHRTFLIIIIICIVLTPLIMAQDHPDDIYWDRGFGRQCGTSHGQNYYDIIIYKDIPIACGQIISYQPIPLPIYNAISWDGIEFSPLSTGTPVIGKSMVEYKNNLIVGGNGRGGIAIDEWNGTSWSTLDTGIYGDIEAIAVLHDSLFVAGWLRKDSVSFAWSIAVWNGFNWGILDGKFNDKINALTVLNDELVVGGDFTFIDIQNINVLAKWSNNSWHSIHDSAGSSVTEMEVLDTMLVIAGELKHNSKVGIIYSLDSLTFLPSSDSVNTITDLEIYNNQITVVSSYTDTTVAGAPVLTWNGTQWNAIGNKLLGQDLSISSWGDSLIVFGTVNLKGQLYINRSALWNGIEWKLNLDDGLLEYTYESVLFQDKIVVGGGFDYVGNETSDQIAFYDGDYWTALGYSDAVNVAGLYCHNDTLYTGGHFTQIGGINANSAAMFDGTTWTDIGFTGICQPGDFIHYNNQLIAGGSRLVIGLDTVTIAYRENNDWVPFAQQPNDDVSSFTIYRNNLIITGKFDSIGTMPAKHIAMWDGTNWTALATSTDHPYTYMGNMIVYNDTLVVTGYFSEINGVQAENLAFWDGNYWSGINSELGTDGHEIIMTVAEYNGQLAIGGHFDKIGGIDANNIAIWDGTEFSSLGSGITSYPGWNPEIIWVSDLQVFQDELYVFGQFFMAGGIESNNIARWTKNSVSTDITDDETEFLLPSKYVLEQNYPNPFNPTTEISFTLPKNSQVTLEIFNILGQKVSTLVDGYKSVGEHKISWDASEFSSGIYLYRLTVAEFVSQKKMVLIK